MNFFHLSFLLKEKYKNTELFHVLTMFKTFPHLKSFMAVFDPHENSAICSAFNGLRKMESF